MPVVPQFEIQAIDAVTLQTSVLSGKQEVESLCGTVPGATVQALSLGGDSRR